MTVDPVQNRVLLKSFQIAPWLAAIVIGTYLVLILSDGEFRLALNQEMFLSGFAAVAIALFAFLMLLQHIRDTFTTLWNRHVVDRSGRDVSDDLIASERGRSTAVGNQDQIRLSGDYQTFLDHLQALLNSPLQWVLGSCFTFLIFTWYPGRFVLEAFRPQSDSVAHVGLSWFILVAVAIEGVVALVIGTMVWRMIIVGIEVWHLGKKFGLRPQLGHPDQCGGLGPLGDLCLWNALIVSVAGLFLGGWIIILRSVVVSDPNDQFAAFYVRLFLELLTVPIVVAAITFFLPLWSVHQIMVARRAEIQVKLDELGQSIDRSARELVDQADKLVLAEGEGKMKRLELMRQVYQQYRQCPTWPFNVPILLKFISSQAVPVLALTGVSEPIRQIVKSLFALQ